MARKSDLETAFAALVDAPWWVSVILSAALYVGLSLILPATAGDGPIANALSSLAAPIAGVLLLLATVSAFRAWRGRRMLVGNRSIEDIRGLNWQEFEELIAAHYRNRGFHTRWDAASGPDGGVDVRLRGSGGETYLVQCKQWRDRSIGVKVVRELFGVVSAEGATGGIVITAGSFTEDARQFAQGLAMELVDGTRLVAMMGEPRGLGAGPKSEPAADAAPKETACPRCGAALVLRTARRGPNVGGTFLGCSTYPACRYTRAS